MRHLSKKLIADSAGNLSELGIQVPSEICNGFCLMRVLEWRYVRRPEK
jgi:hypothetical protein